MILHLSILIISFSLIGCANSGTSSNHGKDLSSSYYIELTYDFGNGDSVTYDGMITEGSNFSISEMVQTEDDEIRLWANGRVEKKENEYIEIIFTKMGSGEKTWSGSSLAVVAIPPFSNYIITKPIVLGIHRRSVGVTISCDIAK